jgi:NADH-quinone oxidoreductase subunit M
VPVPCRHAADRPRRQRRAAFVGWELAGISSWLLIGYTWERPLATGNALFVFLTNRVGDAGFMLGIALAVWSVGTLEWAWLAGDGSLGTVSARLLAAGFVLAALVKSAQLPFTPWIARALEGPTPSSAVFYGSLMVHAGVYLLCRLQGLLLQVPDLLALLAVVGLATAVYGSLCALVQSDVKSALIFSTVTQVGLMFFCCGLGLFWLAACYSGLHAAWRAYQFLLAPAYMHLVRRPARPVPRWLAAQRWWYTAALQRFWIEPLANSLLTRPTLALGRDVRALDERFIDPLVGAPRDDERCRRDRGDELIRGHGLAGRALFNSPTACSVSRTACCSAATVRWPSPAARRALRRCHRVAARTTALSDADGHGDFRGDPVSMPVNEVLWATQAGYPPLATLQCLPLAGRLLLLIMREDDLALVLGRLFAVAELVVAIDLYARIDVSTPCHAVRRAPRPARLSCRGRRGERAVHPAHGAARRPAVVLRHGAPADHAGAAAQRPVDHRIVADDHADDDEPALVCRRFGGATGAGRYLLWRWASAREENLALSRFLQYQLFGWCLFLAGAIVLVWSHADVLGGHWSFDLFDLLQTPQIGKYQSVAFYLLFYGLAIRTPLFPLHGWLPNSAGYGLIAVGPVLLLGVKVGIYGMARFLLPLTAEAVMIWQPYVVAFAMVGVFFAAVMAFRQANLRRLMAFAVVSHTSLIVIGLFTLHPAGLQGALLLAVNFGLAITLMLLMVGYVYRRTGTTNLDRLGGLFDRVPFIAVAFLIGGLSLLGMPGTPGFDAVHLVLEASIETFGALPTIATALGNVVAAGFLLWAFQRAFLAPRPRDLPAARIARTAAWNISSAARRCWCCWPPVSTPSPG